MYFPKVLFVEQPMDKGSSFDGYENFDDAENNTLLGVYELRRVVRVKENCTKTIKEVSLGTVGETNDSPNAGRNK